MPSGPGTYGSKRGRPPMKMKPGGRVGSKKPDNSAAKKKYTLDTHQGGKRIRSDKQAKMIPMDLSGKASSSGYNRPHKTLYEMDSGPTPNKKRVGRAGASLTKKKAGGKVTKKKAGGKVMKKMGGGTLARGSGAARPQKFRKNG